MNFVKKTGLCLLILMLCILAVGCGNVSKDTSEAKETDFNVENCVVTTPWYEFSYPEAMMDVITIEKGSVDFTGDLAFYATLDDKYMLFELKYNNERGDFTVEFENKAGKKVPVSFVMYEKPENLSQSNDLTFMAAQEVVNDVIVSMKLK